LLTFIVSQRRNFYEVPLRELLEVYRGDLKEECTHPRVSICWSFFQKSMSAWFHYMKVCIRVRWPIRQALNSSFCGMKRLGVFPLPLYVMPVHHRVTPNIKFTGIHYTPGWREALCLAQEHNTMSLARVRTCTARSGDEHTNH